MHPLSIKTLTVAFAASLTLFNHVSARFLDTNHFSPRSLSTLFSRTNSGINCDGSSFCALAGNRGSINTKGLVRAVNGLPVGGTFAAGDQLACFDVPGLLGGLCASVCKNTPYFYNGPSETTQNNLAGDIVQDLVNHGCNTCGTAPTNRTGNQLADGCISVNFVYYLGSSRS